MYNVLMILSYCYTNQINTIFPCILHLLSASVLLKASFYFISRQPSRIGAVHIVYTRFFFIHRITEWFGLEGTLKIIKFCD